MNNYYKLRIVLFFFKKWQLVKLINFIWLSIKDRFGSSRRLIYRKSRTDLREVGGQKVASTDIYQIVTREDLQALRTLKSSNHNELWQAAINHIDKAREVWLTFYGDSLSHISCTKIGHASTFFFSLTDKDVLIAHCETLPDKSGRGLYKTTISYISEKLLSETFENVYIDCKEWNWPSRRAIESAGFKLIGYGWDKKGKLSFQPLSQSNNKL